MNVYLRYAEEANGYLFTECAFDEIEQVMAEIKRGGGVYCDGGMCQDLSYQFVLDEGGAYAEIIVGSDA